MEIQRIASIQSELDSEVVKQVQAAVSQHEILKANAAEFVRLLSMFYATNTDTWSDWAQTHLTDDEKAYFKNTYTGIMNMMSTSR